MNDTIAVVGAGLSGLMVAHSLRERGATVIVLEKSRGVGGRMATKRVGEAVFDQGAQFFTARDPRFLKFVVEWAAGGIVRQWPGIAERWVGRPCMTSIAKLLGKDLEVMREHKVTAAMPIAGGWEIALEGHGLMRVERLVLTAPVPQSLAILAQGKAELPPLVAASLAKISYHPCLAVLAVLEEESNIPPQGLSLSEGPIRWIADNRQKGISTAGVVPLTIHASSQFSREHYGDSEIEITRLLLTAAREQIGTSKVLATALHRWKFSEPEHVYPEPCLWLPELALGMAGDGFGGPRVEGAALSGLALAAKIGATLEPKERGQLES